MERIGTVGRENYRKEGCFLRSECNIYQRGLSASIENKSTYCLLQSSEQQEASAADHFRQTRKIHQRESEIRPLEERLDRRQDRNARLVCKLQEQNDQLYYQLQQTKTKLHEKEYAMSEIIMQLKVKLEYQGNEIKEKEQMRQILHTYCYKQTELKKHIALQEAKIKCRDKKLGELEITLDSKMVEISQCKELLKNTVEKKDAQFSEQSGTLHNMLTKLQETEAKMDKAVSLLKEKNQHLQAEIERCNEKVKTLEKMLDSKRNATNDGNERQAYRVMEQNDEQILDLRHQLKQTLDRKESEMNKIIASLKKKTQDLENDVKHRDLTNQHLQAEVERCNEKVKTLEKMLDGKRTSTNDGDGRQSNTVMRQKDGQISDLRHQLKKTLDRKESEMNEIIASLKKKTQDLENEVEHRDMTIKDLGYKKKETIDRNELLEKKVKEKECQLYKERDQRQHAFDKMQEKESEMEGIIASLKKKVKVLGDDIEHRDMKIKRLEEVLNSETIGVPVRKGANRDVTEMERKITKLTDELDQTLTKLHETKTELEERKTRLADNNPNIADLSDKNRPTKLSERYAELYEDQWTDAFDILEKQFKTEENAVAALLQILKDAMIFCRNKAYEQMEDLQRLLALSNDKIYMSHINQSTDKTIRAALPVSSFTTECLEVCWYMVIQDPPIVFAPEPGKGSNLNTDDLLKPYARSGTHVDYVVWPALLLHEGGPVLAKGVAQGYCKT
ncbi:putative leucine-rich repeat-containing protein DDB_G0290503 isoform X2 [Mercenaria mercenaria]|uniref:putative leucine-rich repeat-containing protein DDB_G0290503 isoform X2 n=1 Tax=Mercenaria mercenaria TaxID=6596 RepID=UPI00234F140C|nr:putative leucine-rich repeat-containing protein DDB_G0290503 isoform X2 [Mercenaria mercenaria]